MKKFRVYVTALLTLSSPLSALNSFAASGPGTTGAEFLKVGVGARPLAMGSAFVALPDDANAINWNPGALGEIKQKSVSASYNALFQDQNQGFLAYAMPLNNDMGVVGLGVNYLIISKIEKRAGDTEAADSTFSNQNYAISASYGKASVAQGLSLGGNIKYIHEKLDTFSGSAVAADLGALYRTPIENLSTGLAVQNLGSKIGPDKLPLLAKAGMVYQMFDKSLSLALDGDWLAMNKRGYLDFGAEYWIQNALALRVGYQLGRGQDHLGKVVGLGAGIGLKFDMFNMDYAFLPFGDLGNTHRITLGFKFE
ncbi:MAG: PorV/PorQ family protein [Elusimicrobia bacterium]|nr:PorV/PorQ family protein [Elusimicrobiota bacterium]